MIGWCVAVEGVFDARFVLIGDRYQSVGLSDSVGRLESFSCVDRISFHCRL